jgi:hypothetical protein
MAVTGLLSSSTPNLYALQLQLYLLRVAVLAAGHVYRLQMSPKSATRLVIMYMAHKALGIMPLA